MTLRVAYLISIDDQQDVGLYLERIAQFQPMIVVNQPTIAVVVMRSPFEHDRTADDRHVIIDGDLARLRKMAPDVGDRHPELDGRAIGNRWPMVFETDADKPLGPAEVRVEVGWDNVLVQQASEEMVDRLTAVTAVTLARYRILVDCIRICRDVLGQLTEVAGSSPLSPSTIEGFLGARQNLMISRVVTDARFSVYWGYEQLLLQGIYRAWSMSDIEQAADEAIRTTSTIWNERSARLAQLEAERQSSTARRTAAALLILTLFGGLSAVSTLIEFTGSDSALVWRFLPRGLLAATLLLAFALLLVVNRRALSGRQRSSD